jgi:DNA-binding MarR family transcriptional regulator
MDTPASVQLWLRAYQHQLCYWQASAAWLEACLEPFHMTCAELLVLAELQRAGTAGRTQVEIVRQTSFSAAAVSGLIDQLAKRGWLTTCRAASDRRRVVCALTAEGSTMLHHVLQHLAEVMPQAPSPSLAWPREDAA